MSKEVIKKIKYKKAILVVLSSALALTIFGFLLLNQIKTEHSNKKIVFSVEGEDYDTADVARLTDYAIRYGSVNKEVASKDLFNEVKVIKAADILGYSPTAKDISVEKSKVLSDLKIPESLRQKYDARFTISSEASIINRMTVSGSSTGYSGYSYVFFYGQHLKAIPNFTIENFNNPESVQADKKYAEDRANYYHKLLQDHKIKPGDALTEAAQDMRSRDKGLTNPNFNSEFSDTSTGPWTNGVNFASIRTTINALHSPGLSKISIGETADKAGPGAKNVDMYYYFVYINSAPSKSLDPVKFKQTLDHLHTKYVGVK
jgi:hypothetical protein